MKKLAPDKEHEISTIIEVSELGFAYGGRRIIDNISCSFEEGCFTVILGKNGCGKSTFLRLISGFLSPQEGIIALKGRNLQTYSIRSLAQIQGYLPQQHHPVFPFSAMDVVLTGRAANIMFRPQNKDLEIAEEAIETLGIAHLKRRLFTELSGGEQQLIMLARLLAQQPKVILLDEPISHLDVAFQTRILELLSRLTTEGITVIAILHDPNLAQLYGDRFMCMENGTFLNRADTRKISREHLEKIYEIEMETISDEGRTFYFPRKTAKFFG